ncbi:MAG: hypothetical protein MZV70_12145 [Desulfobacterales bacterium]|nr:hypothetical protein [Desulfobacterales bacterium]
MQPGRTPALCGTGEPRHGGEKESDERFKKFGTVSFTSLTKTNDFIDYLEKGKIAGTRCKDCGRVFSAARGLFPVPGQQHGVVRGHRQRQARLLQQARIRPGRVPGRRPLQHRPARLRRSSRSSAASARTSLKPTSPSACR